MKRPAEVPDTAKYDAKATHWRAGDETTAVERLWSPSGALMLEAARVDGKLHGEVRWRPMIEDSSQFDARLATAKALGLPTGPTHTMIATFDRGELVKVRFRPGLDDWCTDTLVVEVAGGKLHGTLEWEVGSVEGPLFALGGAVLEAKAFKLPKPWPEKLLATFVAGKLVRHAFLDDQGKEIGGDVPIKDWGADTRAKAITGYIERGDLVADAKRFFPNAGKLVVEGLPKTFPKLAKLPAAVALASAVRKKQLPVLGIAIDFSSVGFDCAREALDGAADARYVGVGSDGSGDMYLLDTTTGKVHVYLHEEGKLAKLAFDSLDAFAFAVVRIEAARRGTIPKAALKKTLKALGIAAGAALL